MKKLIILLITISFSLILIGSASATTSPSQVYTSNDVATDYSSIDGHKVVYTKKYSENDNDIWYTDLNTGSMSSVSSSGYDQMKPDISGNIVVWQEKDSTGFWQIYWADLSKGSKAAVVHPFNNDQMNPAVSGNLVVWQQNMGSGSAANDYMINYDIVGYDLANNKYYGSIASSVLAQDDPDISGNNVVYAQYINMGSSAKPNWLWQVYKTKFNIVNKGVPIYSNNGLHIPHTQANPVVSSTGKAAWEEYYDESRQYDIVWVDLNSTTSKNYIYSSKMDAYPEIYGNWIVWMKQGNSSYDIYLQHLTSDSPKIIVQSNSHEQYNPAIGGNSYGMFVSYTDTKDGYAKVYYRNMDSTLPTVNTANPADGAINVARNKKITIKFSEPIKNGNNFIELVSSTGQIVIINMSISGKLLTITHPLLLASNTKYYLKLHSGCINDWANNKLAATTIKFTTGSIIDL